MTTYVFFWLLVVLSLSLLLSHVRHRRKISAQIEEGIADAKGILDSTAEAIVTTNKSGEITKFNLAAEKIFGYSAKHVLGKNLLVLLPKKSHEAQASLMSGSASHSGRHHQELIACKADGTEFPVSLTVNLIHERDTLTYLGTFRDISARKQAEVNNRKSKHLMEFLLQSSPVVFYTCSLKGSFPITYVSPNVENLLGYKPRTITGASAFWSRHIHPNDLDYVHSSRILQMSDGREDLEYRLRMPNGSYHWIADSRTIINDENGQPNLLIGCWTDIHDKKQAEVSLALKEERLRISLKCANLATWDWVINTGKITWSGHINEKIGFNKKLAQDFDNFTSLAHAEDRESLLEAFRQCLVQDEALDIEYRVVWPDNSVHWIHLVGELINDEAGSPVRMAGVLYDITAQKQLRPAPSVHAKWA